MSQLSQQGVFKMTKVLSVNIRAKVWEITKVSERFVISHQHKKFMLLSLQALPGLTLTKSAIGARVDCQKADGILGGVEEVEHQLADRVLEHLNNAGGQPEGCSVN
jgi:hypothetical protein